MIKRAFDLVVVVLTAPVWLLVVAIVAIAVRRRLGRPAIFTQQRPGLHGRPFILVKFRTMTDARSEHAVLLPDADRLTDFGRWLRSTSLDELPELWNVLKGDMSLVGPRPLLMEYLPLYSEEQARRHDVRPGVTGWAQINGRNAIGWREKLSLDVWYVDHHSLWLDMKILWLTLIRVFERHGVAAEGEATTTRFTRDA
jgi:lipopolysaccharide/colanic/teichoic acid biosynthesis glycosyltransferase